VLGFAFGFVDVGGALLNQSSEWCCMWNTMSDRRCSDCLAQGLSMFEMVDSMDFRDNGVEDAAVVLRGCVVACSARLF